MANWIPGAWLAGFIKGTNRHCYAQDIKALAYVVSEKNIFYVFPMVSIWELMTSRMGTFLTPGTLLTDLCSIPLNIVTCEIHKL